MNERDAIIIGGLFLEDPIPRDKFWLLRYCKTDLQKHFMRYMVHVGTHYHFVEHTGYFMEVRYLKRILKRYKKLVAAHLAAKQNGDFDKLAEIEMGLYDLGNK